MTATRHTITTDKDVRFLIPGMPADEHESTTVKIAVTFDCAPGEKSFAPDITLVEAVLVDDGGLDPTPDQVKDWAQDWLDTEGYDAACQRAEAVLS